MKLPLRVAYEGSSFEGIYDADGKSLVYAPGGYMLKGEDAEFIVAACNAYVSMHRSRCEAWDAEEAWRSAVKQMLGADAYANVQRAATTIREAQQAEREAKCEHVLTPHFVTGAPKCAKCGMWEIHDET